MSIELFHYTAFGLLAVVSLLALANFWVLGCLLSRYRQLAEIEQAFAVDAASLRHKLISSIDELQRQIGVVRAAMRAIEAATGEGADGEGSDVVH